MTQPANNPLKQVLDQVAVVVEREHMAVAIAGGLAGVHHGSGVTTLDIDLVVHQRDCDRLAKALEADGFEWTTRSKNGWHVLSAGHLEPVIAVELLPSGQNSPRDPEDASPIPTPQDLGIESGLDFADLAGWVEMKLTAARDKDRYHLHEVCKKITEPQTAQIVQRLRRLPARYLGEFQRLLTAAEADDKTNW